MSEAMIYSLSYVRSHIPLLQDGLNGAKPVKGFCDGKSDFHIYGPLNWEQWDLVFLAAAAAVASVSLAFRKPPIPTAGIVGLLDSAGVLLSISGLNTEFVQLAVKQGLKSLVVGQGTDVDSETRGKAEELGLRIYVVKNLLEALPLLFPL